MEAIKFFEERERMCDSFDSCNKCSLSKDNNETGMDCGDFVLDYPGEAIEIVRKWSEENPKKTNQDVFASMFPDSPWTKSKSALWETCDCMENNISSHLYFPCVGCGWWSEEYKEVKVNGEEQQGREKEERKQKYK